jgi:Immunoglobulin I-set domain
MRCVCGPVRNTVPFHIHGRLLGVLALLVVTLGLLNVAGCNAGFEGAKPLAPLIISQPGNQTVTAGQTATFSVTATGTGPLTYQWYVNGVAISGATSSTYTTVRFIPSQFRTR